MTTDRVPPGAALALALALAAPIAASRSSRADDPPPVRALAFSPDGKQLIAGTGTQGRPGAVLAWDAATGKLLWRRTGPDWFPSVAFSSDGREVVAAHGMPTALRLDPATGTVLGEVGPHPAAVRVVATVPDSGLLATGSDGVVRLWDVKAGTVRTELRGHRQGVHFLAASPNGRWMVSTSPDGTWAWDLTTGRELPGVAERRQGLGYYGVAFVGPDRVLMAHNDGGQRVRELPSGREVLRFKNAGGYDGTAYSPAAGLAAYRWSGTAEVAVADLTFRPPTPAEAARIADALRAFDDDSYAVREAATAAVRVVGSVAEPALTAAAEGGPSPEVRMRTWEARRAILDEPRLRVRLTGPVSATAFSPDGTVLAAGAEDGTVRLWDPLTGRERVRLSAPANEPGG